MSKMAKRPRKKREVPSVDRVLVQALVDPEIKSWLEQMAKERDMMMGPYLRSVLRWMMVQKVDVVAPEPVRSKQSLLAKLSGVPR